MPVKDHLVVALGIGKPKPGLPQSLRSGLRTGMAPAPSANSDGGSPRDSIGISAAGEEPTGAKASPDEAGLVTADQRCGDCVNWSYDTGECSKVEGVMSACAGCRNYFEAKAGGGEAGEPDADDLMTQ